MRTEMKEAGELKMMMKMMMKYEKKEKYEKMKEIRVLAQKGFCCKIIKWISYGGGFISPV